MDLFLPVDKLAFEYQGEQHFQDVYRIGYLWQKQRKDDEKRKICGRDGIKLIEIPYWWDRTMSSLVATIHQHSIGSRDLTANEGQRIIPPKPSKDPVTVGLETLITNST